MPVLSVRNFEEFESSRGELYASLLRLELVNEATQWNFEGFRASLMGRKSLVFKY